MLLQVCCVLFFTIVSINGKSTLDLGQGDTCIGHGKDAWKCKLLKDCPQIGDFKKNNPTICNFQGIDPIICCPPAPQNSSNLNGDNDYHKNHSKESIIASNGNAEKMCLVYSVYHCNRNFIRVRRDNWRQLATGVAGGVEVQPANEVAGGEDAKPREHKAMVMVGYGSANTKSWDCGGTLITENWVLSAAHCAKSPSLGPARWARVGDLDISSTNEDARPQEKRIIQIIKHPNYKEPAVYNDIALFKLDSGVLYSSWVAPICLHTKEEINVPKATVTGWGRLDFAGDVSAKLQEVDITLVNGTECRQLYSNNHDRKIPNGIDTQSMICAGEREGGKDACSGDSGGPLVIKVPGNCIKTQIGIISFGRDCGLPNTPGVYTKVSHFVPWIESIVWPNNS